jgi:hypothetical protein
MNTALFPRFSFDTRNAQYDKCCYELETPMQDLD